MAESTVSVSFFCSEFFFLVILLSAEWLKMSCTGKRKKKEKKKQGGVYSGSIYCKSLDFLCNFLALLSKELALPLSFQLVFWGRGCCADSQVYAPGGAAPPPNGCRLSGSWLPHEDPVHWCPAPPGHRVTPGRTTALAAARSPGLEPAPPVTTRSSQSALAWMLRGRGR